MGGPSSLFNDIFTMFSFLAAIAALLYVGRAAYENRREREDEFEAREHFDERGNWPATQPQAAEVVHAEMMQLSEQLAASDPREAGVVAMPIVEKPRRWFRRSGKSPQSPDNALNV
jgi:hypothetical protein